MNKKIFILSVLCLIILTGCVENKKEESNIIDQIEKNDEQVLEYAYGGGIKDYNGETIVYDKEELEIPFHYFNDSNKLQVGLLIFINGIPQMYSADDSDYKEYHIFDIDEKKSKEITLKLKPNIGKKGDNLNLNFVSVLNPVPVNSLVEYRFNHSINQPMGSNLHYFVDTNNEYIKAQKLAINETISSEDKKRYLNEDVQPQTNTLDDSVVVEVYQDDVLQKDTLETNKLIKVKIAGYSGDYILYKVYDGIKVDPNGIYVSANKDTYDVVEIDTLPDDIKNVYFILVPVDCEHFVVQSERLMVE